MAEVVEAAVQNLEQALSVSHVEQPKAWIQTIAIALKEKGGKAEFWTLKNMTGLSTGATFLGLLLGQDNWTLGQKEFYGTVSVKMKRPG